MTFHIYLTSKKCHNDDSLFATLDHEMTRLDTTFIVTEALILYKIRCKSVFT